MVIDSCMDFVFEPTSDSLFDQIKPDSMDLKSESWFTDCEDKRVLQTPTTSTSTDASSTLDAISEILLFESEHVDDQGNCAQGKHQQTTSVHVVASSHSTKTNSIVSHLRYLSSISSI